MKNVCNIEGSSTGRLLNLWCTSWLQLVWVWLALSWASLNAQRVSSSSSVRDLALTADPWALHTKKRHSELIVFYLTLLTQNRQKMDYRQGVFIQHFIICKYVSMIVKADKAAKLHFKQWGWAGQTMKPILIPTNIFSIVSVLQCQNTLKNVWRESVFSSHELLWLFNGSNLLEVDRHVTIYEEVLLFAATVNIFMA